MTHSSRRQIEAVLVLAACALVAVGAMGPWATGTYVEHRIMSEERAQTRTVHGYDSGGVLILVPALLAALMFVLPLAPRPTYGIALPLLCVSAFGCLLALVGEGVSLGPRIQIFSEWRDVSLEWGLLGATLGALVGVAGCAVGLMRARRWAPGSA